MQWFDYLPNQRCSEGSNRSIFAHWSKMDKFQIYRPIECEWRRHIGWSRICHSPKMQKQCELWNSFYGIFLVFPFFFLINQFINGLHSLTGIIYIGSFIHIIIVLEFCVGPCLILGLNFLLASINYKIKICGISINVY